MAKLTFTAPGRTEPGYLRRMRKALELKENLTKEPTPETLDTLVEFLLPYVTDPSDRGQARDLLWDASQEQFEGMLHAVAGEGRSANPT